MESTIMQEEMNRQQKSTNVHSMHISSLVAFIGLCIMWSKKCQTNSDPLKNFLQSVCNLHFKFKCQKKLATAYMLSAFKQNHMHSALLFLHVYREADSKKLFNTSYYVVCALHTINYGYTDWQVHNKECALSQWHCTTYGYILHNHISSSENNFILPSIVSMQWCPCLQLQP